MVHETLNPRLEILANIAAICAQKQVRHFIISPGSRSAPLTVSIIRHPDLECRVVMDERAAGFIALGLAQQTRVPVGLVCTSGTAALNYGPAVTEAFYQHVPLLIFTADRPPEWIDQQDGQTIHQHDLYGSHCRGRFELPVDYAHPDARWQAERIISEAINLARWPLPGPVHINAPFREPLYPAPHSQITARSDLKAIDLAPVQATLSDKTWAELRSEWYVANKKLIVAGLHPACPPLARALAELQKDPSVAVVADITANLHQTGTQLHHADMVVGTKSSITLAKLKPDLLVTLGGPVVSKNLKLFLRKRRPEAHWHLQPGGLPIDTFQALSRVIAVDPAYFFQTLGSQPLFEPPASADSAPDSYQKLWLALEDRAKTLLTEFLSQAPFSEFSAIYQVMRALPADSHLQLGNSMPVRYANLIGLGPDIGSKHIQVHANRGTSGIDGSLSTAVGAAMASRKLTTLITGDLAFFYDRNALWHNHVPANLRVVILNNHGGGIFKLIDGPGNLTAAELEEFFFTPQSLTARNTAVDHNCDYFCCQDADTLEQQLPEFFAARSKAAILEIDTNSEVNTEAFQRFKSRLAMLAL